MARRFAFILASVLACAVAMPVYAAGEDDLDEFQTKLGNQWVLVKNDTRRNIKTYAKQEDGKRFRSFKVDAVLDSTVESGVRVLLDAENYTKWYWEVFESRMLKQVSPTEYYLYLKHRAPVSLPDRDVILHATVELQKKPSDPITLRVKAAPDYIPEAPPLIRMPAEDMVAHFTPLPNNQVRIEAEGYVDPGGRVPTWANNYIQRNAPYSILVGLLRMMTNESYRKAKTPLPFKVYNSPTDN
ncbi:hypothetical protein [Agitococcus lubricus]|uniref:START domain-containing protein n=1 Tax=Agitococcus lubricus TaxID=1077255 RepID=A0A2T5J2X2_9GAMM|nr:hypothetical protein [Agitococcus lubricus]PTQ90969.1 hypothetical protein C8N29_10138 [Agitococcus lubricus]